MSEATHCQNCGHRIAPWDHFCSQCGQDTKNHPPSLWEFVHEWALHYLAFEGKLWKSLWALMARPGFLTLEYLSGRKQRYVLPLRLLLTLGLLFFLVVKLVPSSDALTKAEQEVANKGLVVLDTGAPKPAQAASRVSKGIELPQELTDSLPTPLRDGIQRSNKRWQQDGLGEAKRIGNAMLGMAPYAVLISLPFFAGLLKLLFWRLRYGAHFVFAMHLHAAWYGMLLLLALAPWAWALFLIWLWSNLYPVRALMRVHGIGGWLALGKAALLALMHWVLIASAALVLLVAGATLGG